MQAVKKVEIDFMKSPMKSSFQILAVVGRRHNDLPIVSSENKPILKL